MTRKAATLEPTGRASYQERVSKKEDIRQRVKALKEKIGAVSSDAHSKRSLAEEADREVSRFIRPIREENEYRGKDKDFMEPWQKEQLSKLRSMAAAAEEAATIAEQRKKTIAQEIHKLDTELANFGYLLGVDEVLRYQEDVAQAKKKVTEFQALIAVQEDIIEKARQAAPDSLDALLRKREDILADISMGKATAKDLEALDEKIAAQDEAVIGFNKIASQVNQVIAGLQRKLTAAEEELSFLQSSRQDVFTEFLMGRAEILGEEYVELSMQLIDKFKQLVALDQIIGHPSRLIGFGVDTFAIPTFRLKAFDGLEQNNSYAGQMRAAQAVAGLYRDNAVIQAAVEEMKAVFAADGINL